MLPLGPERRLRNRKNFQAFYESPEVFKTSSVVLFRIKNSTQHPRLGMTLKTQEPSVVRNRMKRFFREWFRTHQSLLGRYDYNVTLSLRRRIGPLYFKKIRKDLDELLPKLAKPSN